MTSGQSSPTSPARDVSEKLPHEDEHLQALHLMRTLDSYYRWSFDQFKGYIGQRVLDAGCGIGNFVEMALESAAYVMAADLSPQNLQVLRERFGANPKVEIAQVDLDADPSWLANRDIDTVAALDVLEHVKDDIGAMRRLRSIVRPGGHLLVKVPACPWLYGSIDEQSDHFRRYTPAMLRDHARQAGWEPIKAHYMNIAGVLPYFVKSRVLRKRSTFSRSFKPWQLRLIRASVPMLRLLDRVTGPFVGQSAVLIARNPGGGAA